MTVMQDETHANALLPGAAVVVGIRSLLVWAIVAATTPAKTASRPDSHPP